MYRNIHFYSGLPDFMWNHKSKQVPSPTDNKYVKINSIRSLQTGFRLGSRRLFVETFDVTRFSTVVKTTSYGTRMGIGKIVFCIVATIGVQQNAIQHSTSLFP